jgi:polar amino acid transport system substrate-binding protein
MYAAMSARRHHRSPKVDMRVVLALLQIALAASLALACVSVRAAEKVRLGYSDVQNFPYQSGDGSVVGDPPGLAVELIRLAAHELGVDVEFVRLPAMRLFVAMQSNDIDGAFIFSFKEDRLQYGSFPMRDGKPDRSRRITTINYSFYKSASSPATWNGSTLLNNALPVGMNTGFSIGDDLRKLGLTVDDGAKGTAQNISKLQRGRIGAYATLDASADVYLQRYRINDVIKINPPITSRDYYLMFSKRFSEVHGALAERLWSRIGALRDKRSPELIEKYIN